MDRRVEQCPKIIQANSNGFNKDHYPIDALFKSSSWVDHDLDETQATKELESQNFFIRVINRFLRLVFVDFFGLANNNEKSPQNS